MSTQHNRLILHKSTRTGITGTYRHTGIHTQHNRLILHKSTRHNRHIPVRDAPLEVTDGVGLAVAGQTTLVALAIQPDVLLVVLAQLLARILDDLPGLGFG